MEMMSTKIEIYHDAMTPFKPFAHFDLPKTPSLALLPALPDPNALDFFIDFLAILSAFVGVSTGATTLAFFTFSVADCPAVFVDLTFSCFGDTFAFFSTEAIGSSADRFLPSSLFFPLPFTFPSLPSLPLSSLMEISPTSCFLSNRPSSLLLQTGNMTLEPVLIPTDKTLSHPSSINSTAEEVAARRLSTVCAGEVVLAVAMRMELAMQVSG